VAALLASGPDAWASGLAPVLAMGREAAPGLVAGLQRQPGAPGAQAAVAALGRTGDEDSVPFLSRLVEERTTLAAEAALALGELRAAAAAPALVACVEDRIADPTLRTAAACALVRCGRRAEATPLLEAVWLAGTPQGAERSQSLGLPERPRWALERYLILRLLLQEGAVELADGFDTDAPWPELERTARLLVQWLSQP
jgi:HEAT repeat protein